MTHDRARQFLKNPAVVMIFVIFLFYLIVIITKYGKANHCNAKNAQKQGLLFLIHPHNKIRSFSLFMFSGRKEKAVIPHSLILPEFLPLSQLCPVKLVRSSFRSIHACTLLSPCDRNGQHWWYETSNVPYNCTPVCLEACDNKFINNFITPSS